MKFTNQNTFSASLLIVGVGINVVWTSPVIWKLKSNNTEINPLGVPIATFQVALIAGLVPLGGVIGTIFLEKLCDVLGRRKALMVLSTTMLLFETILSLSSNIYLYYVARFVIGICVGVGMAVTSVFLSEISEDHNRGTIGCFVGLSLPIGNLFVYVFGPLFSIKVFTLLCTLPNVINLLCLITFIPESPIYLASRGHRAKTIEALEKLRNKSPGEVEKEFENIIQTLESTAHKVEPTWRSMFKVKSLRKGFIIAIGLNALQQLSGVLAILAYAGPLFDAAGVSLSGDMVAVLIGLVQLFGVFLATVIIERTGRRPLLMVSTVGGSTAIFLLGLFYYLKNKDYAIVGSILWLPIASVLLFIVAFSLGLGVIPTAIMSEIFPSNVKSKASSASSGTALLIVFIVTTIFPIMVDLIGPSWCLWVFCIFGLLGYLFVYFIVPEIKGKSLVEVQELLSK